MFEKQQGNCKVCLTHQSRFKKRLFVDHCHITGKIRGLLCSHCNTLLGQAKDSIQILESAINYLKESTNG